MSKTRRKPRHRYDSACWRGAVAGILVWGLAVLGAWGFEAFEPWSPEWFKNLDLPDTLGTICAVAAAPVPIGGWLFIWGDSGPPVRWISSWAFVIAFGVSSYGLLGSLTGVLISWLRGQQR